jgi:hypothetical protein
MDGRGQRRDAGEKTRPSTRQQKRREEALRSAAPVTCNLGRWPACKSNKTNDLRIVPETVSSGQRILSVFNDLCFKQLPPSCCGEWNGLELGGSGSYIFIYSPKNHIRQNWADAARRGR